MGRKLTGSFLDLRLIAARGNCLLFGWCDPGGGSETKTCLGMSYRVRQGFTLSRAFESPLPFYGIEKVEKKRSIITSHLSSLQLQGKKQVVCEFDPHPGGGKRTLTSQPRGGALPYR